WLALFKMISQTFSWTITILVARILSPDDYGLMEMATMLAGYALIFKELGLGKAIIQKPTTTKNELSSVFWFSIAFSVLLALCCFLLAYPTAHIFNDRRVIPLVKSISVVFIISGLQIVPFNLLKKELQFKIIGLMQMISVFVSASCMVIIAYLGGGVWTLLGGYIIQSSTHLVLVYLKMKWVPSFHFNFEEAKSYLKFGIIVSITGSFSYVNEKMDRFFAGRAWSSNMLGFYTLALQLSQIPTEKIVVLINQVSFPAFSQLQYQKDKFNKFYINIVRITVTLVLPIFVGAYLVSEDLIKVLLNEKWYPIIYLFKYLCLTQIISALNAVNSVVHTAQGRPHWHLGFNIVRAIVMSTSFYFAVQYGLHAIIVPWFTTYLIICLLWLIITLKKLEIGILIYIRNLYHPVIGTGVMTLAVLLCHNQMRLVSDFSPISSLIPQVIIGALAYISYLWFFNRELYYELKKLRKA
ncbi:MAG: lipopolysaccharide biosynthesis protein, partial [Ignavibacteria bacterium]|nr:lipopolysaccharide biosynthesis protein [Ignavibacteria bacterium]